MRAIREFLGNEERAPTVLIIGAVGLMLAGLVVALCAIYPLG